MSDPLPPISAPPTDPAPRPARTRCEFCKCQLTPTGDVMSMSDEARELRDQTEAIAKLKATLANAETKAETLQRDLEAARAQLAAAVKPADAASRGW